MPLKPRIKVEEIVLDIRDGMTDSELIKKHNLSRDQLRSRFKQLAKLRETRIQRLVGDLRSGMASSELMKKYQLSAEGLANLFKWLLEANSIGQAEFETLRPFDSKPETETELRGSLRNYPITVTTSYEVGNPGKRYQVRDISENGIGIIGIRPQVGEMKSLVVTGDELGEIAPFEFDAQCRWARQPEPGGWIRAGFKITRMGANDLSRLREFIQGFTFGLEGA
jgi:uncharacterized protein (DUF433 family)